MYEDIEAAVQLDFVPLHYVPCVGTCNDSAMAMKPRCRSAARHSIISRVADPARGIN